jgi:hypothetical protein
MAGSECRSVGDQVPRPKQVFALAARGTLDESPTDSGRGVSYRDGMATFTILDNTGAPWPGPASPSTAR